MNTLIQAVNQCPNCDEVLYIITKYGRTYYFCAICQYIEETQSMLLEA